MSVSAAIAGTPVCARALTRHAHGRIIAPGEELEAVAPLPVFALGADDAITRGLRRAGLKTIGDVAARGRHEIAARFGAAFIAVLEQALGQRDAPINPRKPLPDFIVEKRFAEPIATDGVIAMTLAEPGAHTHLRDGKTGQGRATAGSELLSYRRRGPHHCCRGWSPDHARQRLSTVCSASGSTRWPIRSIPASASIWCACRLSALSSVVQEQRDLDTHVQNNDEVAALIDRIAARIGSHRIVMHLPQDTHIPERAVLSLPAQHHLTAAATGFMACAH